MVLNKTVKYMLELVIWMLNTCLSILCVAWVSGSHERVMVWIYRKFSLFLKHFYTRMWVKIQDKRPVEKADASSYYYACTLLGRLTKELRARSAYPSITTCTSEGFGCILMSVVGSSPVICHIFSSFSLFPLNWWMWCGKQGDNRKKGWILVSRELVPVPLEANCHLREIHFHTHNAPFMLTFKCNHSHVVWHKHLVTQKANNQWSKLVPKTVSPSSNNARLPNTKCIIRGDTCKLIHAGWSLTLLCLCKKSWDGDCKSSASFINSLILLKSKIKNILSFLITLSNADIYFIHLFAVFLSYALPNWNQAAFVAHMRKTGKVRLRLLLLCW